MYIAKDDDINELIKKYSVDPKQGLSSEQVMEQKEKYGANILQRSEPISALRIFLQQFNSMIVYILFAAVFISAAIPIIESGGELHVEHLTEALVILVIIVLNAVLGFVQEYKAEKSIESLKKLASLQSIVIRDGEPMLIDAEDIVPGDIVQLNAGDKVPADGRVIQASTLEIQEAALTGESMPVKKDTPYIDAQQLGDQTHRAFAGTIVTKGRGLALITDTGMYTEIGKIASMIHEAEPEETPLQRQLDHVGRQLGILTIVVCVVVFLVGFVYGKELLEFLLISVGLAVAAIPEGLPAVVTIGLALGVQRMIRHKVLVRKLHAVETLGSTSIICSDKTGTLTKNQMTVRKLYVNNEEIEVSGLGYSFQGMIGSAHGSEHGDSVETLLRIGQLCNDAIVRDDGSIVGDPTEAALVVSAEKGGVSQSIRSNLYERIDEIPFDSDRKMMSTIHKMDNQTVMYTKGAPDKILEKATHIYLNGKEQLLTESHKDEIRAKYEAFGSQALRVLGFAYGKSTQEKDLIFVGLQAMIDPPRQSTIDAIAAAKQAGIRVVMITGDHLITAQAIAKEIGIEGDAMHGDELSQIDNLHQTVKEYSIFARVNPADKMKLVTAMQENEFVVAMTGDGVNDAPALKKSDIGICVGSGTDVAKEASDMILLKDDFASIVKAVEEGRGIYDNIKKFVRYMLASNIGEIMIIFVAVMINNPEYPLPLIAIQILRINLLTDGFPALALSVEPIDHDVMQRPPRKMHTRIIDKASTFWMAGVATVMTIGILALFYTTDPAQAQTVAFTALMVFQMFNVLNCKSITKSAFVLLHKNMWLWIAIVVSLMLQISVVQMSWGNALFNTVPLSLEQRATIVVVASSVLWLDEFRKLIDDYFLNNKRKIVQ